MEASSALLLQTNHGIMEEDEEELVGSMLSSSFSDEELGECSSNSMGSSTASDFTEDAASSSLEGPLFEMSSLLSQLPFKRGLSIHFEGKSQSFTSLCDARSLEDLAKPATEAPLTKMMMRKSYNERWGMQDKGSHNKHKVASAVLSPKGCSRIIAKKSSRGSFVIKKTSSFLGNLRPPPPPSPTRTRS